ncbi:Protein of unknown function [Pyronema omphalodes CBS 100304]|uniref:Uncharacterized protein n=1 Tax=Pyronema omphalodes (strain CBS 100304) TaxID=1076935 RepID=U4KV41_PYROM|nr:Protein of unknown function [Pyronema omphalodes CBS 100304]
MRGTILPLTLSKIHSDVPAVGPKGTMTCSERLKEACRTWDILEKTVARKDLGCLKSLPIKSDILKQPSVITRVTRRLERYGQVPHDAQKLPTVQARSRNVNLNSNTSSRVKHERYQYMSTAER